MKLDILAIGVHPDDIEMGAGGTLLKQIAFGNSVGLLDLTRGELGSRGSADIRKEESTRAAEIMGAKVRVQLGLPDGFSEITRSNLLKIIQVIRTYQPDIVLANAVKDRHPDHGRAAKWCIGPAFYLALSKSKQNPPKIKFKSHGVPRPSTITSKTNILKPTLWWTCQTTWITR